MMNAAACITIEFPQKAGIGQHLLRTFRVSFSCSETINGILT
jgi:hypothetical protein